MSDFYHLCLYYYYFLTLIVCEFYVKFVVKHFTCIERCNTNKVIIIKATPNPNRTTKAKTQPGKKTWPPLHPCFLLLCLCESFQPPFSSPSDCITTQTCCPLRAEAVRPPVPVGPPAGLCSEKPLTVSSMSCLLCIISSCCFRLRLHLVVWILCAVRMRFLWCVLFCFSFSPPSCFFSIYHLLSLSASPFALSRVAQSLLVPGKSPSKYGRRGSAIGIGTIEEVHV